jgi:hypothetical protein
MGRLGSPESPGGPLLHPDNDGNPDVQEETSTHLKQIDGWWVICGGAPTDFSIVDLIDQLRNERIRALGGE